MLRSFRVPHEQIAKDIRAANQSHDAVALKPGDPVAIDVSGLPRDRQDEIADVLTDRLREMGFRPAPRADVTLKARVDKKSKSITQTYYKVKTAIPLPSKESIELTYLRRRAWLEFEKQGKVLWSAYGSHDPPSYVRLTSDWKFTKEYGTPKYSIYSEHRLPEYLRGRKVRTGSTSLYADGIR